MRLGRHFRFANLTTANRLDAKIRPYIVAWNYLEDRFYTILIAVWTYLMHWFGALSLRLQRISKGSAPKFLKLIALLLSFPFFKVSHFFFKRAYILNHIRLRRLCVEDFFLKFYDRRIATGGVTDVLQSLRNIERGLKDADAFSKGYTTHDFRS